MVNNWVPIYDMTRERCRQQKKVKNKYLGYSYIFYVRYQNVKIAWYVKILKPDFKSTHLGF